MSQFPFVLLIILVCTVSIATPFSEEDAEDRFYFVTNNKVCRLDPNGSGLSSKDCNPEYNICGLVSEKSDLRKCYKHAYNIVKLHLNDNSGDFNDDSSEATTEETNNDTTTQFTTETPTKSPNSNTAEVKCIPC